MVGKDCVAIACDLRLGMQALTVSNNFPKIFAFGDVYLGLTGLATDVATVADLLRYKVNMYRLREERSPAPQTLASLVSSSLYERRFGPFFISPVVAGINHKTGAPFICGFDSIGCIDFAKDFIVSGTASDQLFGTCEGLWEPNLVCKKKRRTLAKVARGGEGCLLFSLSPIRAVGAAPPPRAAPQRR